MTQLSKQRPLASASTWVRTCRWNSESQWHNYRFVSAYKRWQHWYCVAHTCHSNTPSQKHNSPQKAAHRRCRDRSSGRRHGWNSENPLHNYRSFPARTEHEPAGCRSRDRPEGEEATGSSSCKTNDAPLKTTSTATGERWSQKSKTHDIKLNVCTVENIIWNDYKVNSFFKVLAKEDAGQMPGGGTAPSSYNAKDKVPSNVNELLTRAQLDNSRDVYRLIEARSELNPYQDRELAVKIISKLSDYHRDKIQVLTEEGKADEISAWATDFHRLQVAIDMLEEVELSDD